MCLEMTCAPGYTILVIISAQKKFYATEPLRASLDEIESRKNVKKHASLLTRGHIT